MGTIGVDRACEDRDHPTSSQMGPLIGHMSTVFEILTSRGNSGVFEALRLDSTRPDRTLSGDELVSMLIWGHLL